MGNRKDEAVISALLTNATIRAASECCGVSETRIYARLRNPEFKARYDAERLAMLERNSNALQVHIATAIEGMVEIANDPKVAAQTRLNAQRTIIETSLKLTEIVDLLQRIRKLEEVTNIET